MFPYLRIKTVRDKIHDLHLVTHFAQQKFDTPTPPQPSM